ncbi:TIGR00341 family protein [Aquibacillus koreensis]|uniref:TIGR00341 family protein n=1 Tax=Aquibacillus koreensis TaxID=279446 RepID=A0A9X3WMV0_9BACI|nr:TIGR00341 family protein [Aquibacillus koreensis]MCT2535753.1 TIGR00341 family protein [Aquibacillus koreensis]MDC3420209.1 TIGR00341 family protein [Aquibacillus koreensis]
MELQLIEVYIPKQSLQKLLEKIEEYSTISYWHTDPSDDQSLVRILVKKTLSEEILNFLEMEAKHDEHLHALLYNVHTYIPRVEDEEDNNPSTNDNQEKKAELLRASRHELYTVVHSSSEITRSFTWFLLLSAIVATAGIIKNSPAIVIGAMVIAPLIGPFTSLAFAAILGDYKLMRQSVITSLYGLVVPLCIAAAVGFFLELPVESDEFQARTQIEMMDIAVALAAGAAGALSFIKRVSEALVGVMVSVALLPPTVVFGMMLGSSNWTASVTPLLLLLVNISSIILSAILVFWFSGIKPVNWKEIQTANTSRKFALIFVSMVVFILCIVIYIISI